MGFWGAVGDNIKGLVKAPFETAGAEKYGGDLINGMDRSNNEFRSLEPGSFNLPGYTRLDLQNDELIKQLQGRAAGQGPSLADMQMQRGLQASLAQQQAMAQSGRGNPAMAQRQAAINSGNISQNMAGQGAMARLAEQNQAQQQLQGALQGQLNLHRSQQQGQQAYQDARSQRFNSMLGVPTDTERGMSMAGDLAKMIAMGA